MVLVCIVRYSALPRSVCKNIFPWLPGNFRETSGSAKRSHENGRRPTMEAGGVKALRRPRASCRGTGVFSVGRYCSCFSFFFFVVFSFWSVSSLSCGLVVIL